MSESEDGEGQEVKEEEDEVNLRPREDRQMITYRIKSMLPSVVSIAALLALLAASPAGAAPVANRFLPLAHFGRGVNKATGANVCGAKEECQPGRENDEAGGFFDPKGVAVDNDPASPDFGNVYVADTVNRRVQELTATGQFVRMFGWDVNQTKVEAGAALQSERNVCTAESKDVCQAGVEGAAAGQFGPVESIAVDPASGAVYVGEYVSGGPRVQKFTTEGQFVLEIGREVNETTKVNLCTEEETIKAGVKCGGPTGGGSEPGAFDFEAEYGDLLTVGGPEDLLYVGDEGRVQRFKSSGEFAGEISLAGLSATGRALGVAVDPAGDVFVTDSEAAGIHEYNAAKVLQSEVIDPASTRIRDIALDHNGQLGILEGKTDTFGNSLGLFGFLYSTSGAEISEFSQSSSDTTAFTRGLAFAGSDELYVTKQSQEIEAYTPIVFPETRTCPAEEITATSAKLCGEINPDGVPATGFFQYGSTPPLGSQTPVVFQGMGEAFTPVSAVTSLEPNETYDYTLAAEAEFAGEKLQGHGEEMTFRTPAVATQIVGAPSASFVTAQSAVISASLNPEHLSTLYHFEYGPCPNLEGCPTILSTPEEESSRYPAIGTTQEIRGLLAQTTYSYRLVASNEKEEAGKTIGGKAIGVEGTFTTGALATVQAATGSPSAITATSAVISGAVNPDGQPATYTFELGVYAGSATQYGVVFSGPTGTETTPVSESLALSGLQPGVTYAYKIAIHSGYGTAEGTPATFTTQGLPSVLAAPPVAGLLAIPAIPFPTAAPPSKSKAKSKKPKNPKKRAHKKKHRVKTRRTKHGAAGRR
jgi:hypothetical protein